LVFYFSDLFSLEEGLPVSSTTSPNPPLIAVVMGSQTDWETMVHASDLLTRFQVPHECLVVSAHRTPEWLSQFAKQAETSGIRAIIAGAGGAAHLPGMIAAQTSIPVVGVPVASRALNGMDSLLSIVQMPGGVPVATMAIGKAGSINAALYCVALLAHGGQDDFAKSLLKAYQNYRTEQTQSVLEKHVLRKYPEGSGVSIFSPNGIDSSNQQDSMTDSPITQQTFTDESEPLMIEEPQPVYASGSHLTGVNLPPVPKRPVDNTQSAGFHA
jgi:5-(carboxyamino)imidazole ribonucleotide mutase